MIRLVVYPRRKMYPRLVTRRTAYGLPCEVLFIIMILHLSLYLHFNNKVDAILVAAFSNCFRENIIFDAKLHNSFVLFALKKFALSYQ